MPTHAPPPLTLPGSICAWLPGEADAAPTAPASSAQCLGAPRRMPTASDAVAMPWWSFGKTVLAAAALALVAQGRLALDAPHGDASWSLRQLLQHRAGFGDYGAWPDYHAAVASNALPWSAETILARGNTLVMPPGQGWAYSNIGYLHLRRMIEAQCASPLLPALQTLVLSPLGIGDVTLAETPADLAGAAWGNVQNYHPGWVYHGLLLGPASSAVRVLAGLLGGQLLPPSLLSAMQAPCPIAGQVPGRPFASMGYGLGLMVGHGAAPCGQAPLSWQGHSGQGPGSVAAVYAAMGAPGVSGTAAVFAPINQQGPAEAACQDLALTRAPM